MRPALIASVLGLGLLAAPALAQTPPGTPPVPVTGRVIQDGSWDGKVQPTRGFLPAGWLGLQVRPRTKICFTLKCARYSLKLVKNPVRDGTRAARFDVRDGDDPFRDRSERAEVQGKSTGKAGSMRWYTWSTYFPPGFPAAKASDSRWLSFTQWAVNRGAAPVQMTVHRGQIVLQINEQASPTKFLGVHRPWGIPAAPLLGTYVDFAVFVRWSPGNDGQIQLWVNGVQQTMNWPFGGVDPARFGGVGSFTYTGETMVPRGGATYLRQGIVRSRAFPGRTTLVHDAMRVYAATAAPVPPAPPAPVPLPAPTPPA